LTRVKTSFNFSFVGKSLTKLNLPTPTIQALKQRLGVNESGNYDFLGIRLNVETGNLTDKLKTERVQFTEMQIQILATLLLHFTQSKPVPITGEPVKFKDLPGGYAYEGAFEKRAIDPIVECFGDNPIELVEAAKLLNGKPLNLGDASVEIMALTGIPLTYILWSGEEFPSSVNILFDKSASNYLPTEDLAVLGEVTTARLIEAKNSLHRD
jgi:hypothetical protein